MRERITAERARDLLIYNKETGSLTWRVSAGRSKKGNAAGWKTDMGYMEVHLDGRTYQSHRICWLISNGEHPNGQIDHMDCNRSNNALSNLRVVSAAVNMQNQRNARSNNRSGLIGATFSHGKYAARIMVAGKYHDLGRFETAEEAHKAYVIGKRRLHEGCTL